MTIYYWATFALTFMLALAVPTKLTPTNNVIGSFIVALFGFVLWPVAALAVWKTRRNAGVRKD